MAVDLFANAANTTLAAGIAAGAVTLTVASSTPFPAVTTAAATQFRVIIDAELFIVTNVTGTTWTVTPGAEGTTQAAHANAAVVTAIATAGALNAKMTAQVGAFLLSNNGGQSLVRTIAAAGTAQTLDLSLGSWQDLTLNAASCALTFPSGGAFTAGRVVEFNLILRQDATGSRLITFPGNASFVSAAPTLSTAAGKVDVLYFFSLDQGATWLGLSNVSAAATVTTVTNDLFTRADSATTLGSTPQGQAYVAGPTLTTPAAGIITNTAYFATAGSAGAGGALTALINAGVSDCTVSIDYPVVGGGQAIYVRSAATAPGEQGILIQAGGSVVVANAGGASSTYTGITLTSGTATWTPANADHIDVILSGSTITVKRNGTTQWVATVTANQTATYFGLRSDNTAGGLAARFDNFKITVP